MRGQAGHQEMVGLAEAAQRLAMPYQNAHRLVLLGKLRGEKRANRWYVVLSDVELLVKEREGALAKAPYRDPP